MPTCIHASLLVVVRSYSLLSRRLHPSQAYVRSTTQRMGSTSNFLPLGRLTTSMQYLWPACSTHSRKGSVLYLESSKITSSRCRARSSSLPSTAGAERPSCSEAAVTATASTKPSVSTTTCRLRPLTFLPPSTSLSAP